MYDASNRKDVRKAEKAARQQERTRQDIIKGIMSVAGGRSWMLDILESCHVFASSFSIDSSRMAFSEGERNVGLQLLNDIMAACPDQYVVMMRERNERNLAAERTRADPRG